MKLKKLLKKIPLSQKVRIRDWNDRCYVYGEMKRGCLNLKDDVLEGKVMNIFTTPEDCIVVQVLPRNCKSFLPSGLMLRSKEWNNVSSEILS